MDPITLWDAFHSGFHLPAFALVQPEWILDLGANAGYTDDSAFGAFDVHLQIGHAADAVLSP